MILYLFLQNYNLGRAAPYVKNMSSRGKAVMASLIHWCGFGFMKNYGAKKCYHKSCPNHLRNALIGKTATDSDLKNALIKQRQCLDDQRQSQFKINRMTNEINFLN